LKPKSVKWEAQAGGNSFHWTGIKPLQAVGTKMNKRTTISVISVLAVGAIVLWVFYFQETDKLKDAQAEIEEIGVNIPMVDVESHISALYGGDVITFTDVNLTAAIRETLNKSQGPIYKSDLKSLTVLVWHYSNTFRDLLESAEEAPEKRIADLTGLEYCVNLQVLSLYDNNISNIPSLAGLTHLQMLYLYDNNISDISALAGLTNLESLTLLNNNISDISPLASLANLEQLYLGSNNISDISPLASLTNLTYIELYNNNISDISPLVGFLSLRELYLQDNNISDISPLLANSGLLEGGTVYLRGNPLSTASINDYIPQLEARGVNVVY
jgi:Leucine-rich repeat (LRR) protein